MTSFTLFNLLTKQEQADMLLEEGAYLYTRQEPEFLIDLYTLDDFFVEVYYHKRQHQLVVVKSFYACEQKQQEVEALIPSLTVAWRNPFSSESTCGYA